MDTRSCGGNPKGLISMSAAHQMSNIVLIEGLNSLSNRSNKTMVVLTYGSGRLPIILQVDDRGSVVNSLVLRIRYMYNEFSFFS